MTPIRLFKALICIACFACALLAWLAPVMEAYGETVPDGGLITAENGSQPAPSVPPSDPGAKVIVVPMPVFILHGETAKSALASCDAVDLLSIPVPTDTPQAMPELSRLPASSPTIRLHRLLI